MLPRSTKRHFRWSWLALVFVASLWIPKQVQAQTVWFRRTIPTTTELGSVAYGGGFYSAVAFGRPKVLQSRDGRVWTASPLPDLVNQVTYFGRSGKEGFYGVGGTYLLKSAQATAGYAFSNEVDQILSQQQFAFSGWNSLSAYGGKLVLLGNVLLNDGFGVDPSGVNAPIILLFDNSGWNKHTEPAQDIEIQRNLGIDSVVVGESKILFFSRAATNGQGFSRVWIRDLSVLPPQDTWTSSEILPPSGTSWGDLTAGAYGAGAFMLVGKGGKIFRIPESTKIPQARSIPTNASLSGVAYGTKGGGCWVAVGACGTVLCSMTPTAESWISIPTRIMDDLNAVTYGVNSFVAVGEGGTILQSN